MLSQGMARMFSASLKQEPSLLHEVFNLDSVAILQADVDRSSGLTSDISLDAIFRSLALWNPFRDLLSRIPARNMLELLPEILTSYPAIDCLVNFLGTGDGDDIKLVVDHILDAVDPWISTYGSPGSVISDDQQKPHRPTFNAIQPFLLLSSSPTSMQEQLACFSLAVSSRISSSTSFLFP